MEKLTDLSKEELLLKLNSLKTDKKFLMKQLTNLETQIGYIIVLLENKK